MKSAHDTFTIKRADSYSQTTDYELVPRSVVTSLRGLFQGSASMPLCSLAHDPVFGSGQQDWNIFICV